MRVAYKNGAPVVPKGWRKLRTGEKLKTNDKWDDRGNWESTFLGGEIPVINSVYIRKKGTK